MLMENTYRTELFYAGQAGSGEGEVKPVHQMRKLPHSNEKCVFERKMNNVANVTISSKTCEQ